MERQEKQRETEKRTATVQKTDRKLKRRKPLRDFQFLLSCIIQTICHSHKPHRQTPQRHCMCVCVYRANDYSSGVFAFACVCVCVYTYTCVTQYSLLMMTLMSRKHRHTCIYSPQKKKKKTQRQQPGLERDIVFVQ